MQPINIKECAYLQLNKITFRKWTRKNKLEGYYLCVDGKIVNPYFWIWKALTIDGIFYAGLYEGKLKNKRYFFAHTIKTLEKAKRTLIKMFEEVYENNLPQK